MMTNIRPKVPTFEKPKGLKRLPGLGKQAKIEPLPDLSVEPERFASLVDDELAQLTRMLGDDPVLAKRILRLKKKFYNVISGTIPELIIMDWLDRKGYKYEFQYFIKGSWTDHGNQILDFVVDAGARVIVIEMQGYFHLARAKVENDQAQRMQLMGLEIWGRPVTLVEVWERRLIDKHLRNAVMEAAMNGIELGK